MKTKQVHYGDPAPFDTYLLVQIAGESSLIAFEVLDSLDIDELLQKALNLLYDGYGVQLETWRQMGGSNHACIITDSRDTDSVIVWDSCDFHYTLEGNQQ